ncbi:MAG: hypothetical protein II347_06390 [Lachnospiraceae bacterium]|nr:hypothetical protein [Lachnospiraceae bacterium]
MQSTIIKKTIILLLVASLLCSLLGGCGEKKPQPEDTIFALQEAINNLDVDGLLMCIDSEWAIRVEKLLSLSVGKEGLSVENFITLVKKVMPILPFVSKGAVDADDLPQVEFTILSTDITIDTATVSIMMTTGELVSMNSITIWTVQSSNRGSIGISYLR